MNYPLYTFLTVLAVCGTMLWMQPQKPFGAAVNISATGTSTLPNGLNLTTGCLTRAGGSCLGGLSGYERVTGSGSSGPTTASNTTNVTVDCTSGKKVVGGGGDTTGTYQGVTVSKATDDDTWSFTVMCYNGGGCTAGTVTAYAICISP